jgi:transcriptional regulator with XRE-family HTH domain
VADDAYGAIVAKQRLSRRLAVLRTPRTGLSLNEVSDKLGWSRGRLDRYERNDWRLPDASHVRDLARIYQASDEEREELEDLGRQARQRVWWRTYEDVFGKGNEFAGFENDAARISVYMPLVIPGLLQTRAYAQALLAVGPTSPQWRERALAARMRRQQILDRADGTAPRLVAVLTEASLMYRWGSQQDRRAQVEHLAAMSRRRSVEVRLLRFADGPHPGMISPFNIFDFPDDEDPAVVYLETDTGIQEVTKADDVEAYKQTFARIRDAALAPAATRTYLDTLSQTQE